MRSSTKKKVGPRSEPIESNQTKEKKQYSPPRFELLRPNQPKVRLTERALPGEAAAERILDASSRLERVERTAGAQAGGQLPFR